MLFHESEKEILLGLLREEEYKETSKFLFLFFVFPWLKWNHLGLYKQGKMIPGVWCFLPFLSPCHRTQQLEEYQVLFLIGTATCSYCWTKCSWLSLVWTGSPSGKGGRRVKNRTGGGRFQSLCSCERDTQGLVCCLNRGALCYSFFQGCSSTDAYWAGSGCFIPNTLASS